MNDKEYTAELERIVIENEWMYRARRRAFEGSITGMVLAVIFALAVVAFVEHHWPRDTRFLPGGAK